MNQAREKGVERIWYLVVFANRRGKGRDEDVGVRAATRRESRLTSTIKNDDFTRLS